MSYRYIDANELVDKVDMNTQDIINNMNCVYIDGILPNNQIFNLDEHDESVRKEVIEKYNWISVKDKMPKDCNEDWVLVLVYDGDFRCIPTVAEYRNGHWYGHTFCVDDDCIDGEDSPFEVRYWKPIYDEIHIEELLKEKSDEKFKINDEDVVFGCFRIKE